MTSDLRILSARARPIRDVLIKTDSDTPARLSVRNRVLTFRRSPSLENLDLVERSLLFLESREIEAPGRGRGRILRTHPPSPPPSRAPRPAADPASRQRPTRSKSFRGASGGSAPGPAPRPVGDTRPPTPPPTFTSDRSPPLRFLESARRLAPRPARSRSPGPSADAKCVRARPPPPVARSWEGGSVSAGLAVAPRAPASDRVRALDHALARRRQT